MLTKIRKSAQSTLEYALLIGIVAGGLLYMQNYVKRGVQGKVQAAVDDLGDQYSPGLTYRHEFMRAELEGQTTETTRGGIFDGSTTEDGLPIGTTTVDTGKTTQTQRSVRRLKALEDENWTATGGAAAGQ